MDSFEKDLESYRKGVIAKENTDLNRYQQYPADVNISDVGKCCRAIAHLNESLKNFNAARNQLAGRRKHLYSEDDMKPKSWADNEICFIGIQYGKISELIKEVQPLVDNCQHTLSLLEKRYSRADVNASERKRKLKRQKEQRSKSRRRLKQRRQAIASLIDTDDNINIDTDDDNDSSDESESSSANNN